MTRNPLSRSLALLLLCAGGLALAAETPYLNWQPIAAPVQGALTIRQDAMGDGRFGVRRSGGRWHRGIDLAAPVGAPVMAIRSGRVLDATTGRGEGRYIVLDHGGGLHSLYLHLSAMEVRRGQRVRQGQRIGTVGKTGNARHPWIAPHLHMEITRRGEPVDPAGFGLTAAVTHPDHAAPETAEDEQ